MKKFINRFLLFCFFGSSLYIVFILSCSLLKFKFFPNVRHGRAGNGFLLSRLKDADTTKNIDVLILGSSHAYRGYDTRIFKESGYACFNLGSSAQTPEQTEILVDDYIDRFAPKLIIYEVFPYTFQLDGIESSVDILSNRSVDGKISFYVLRSHHPILINSYLYALGREIVSPISESKEPARKLDRYVAGGYVERFNKKIGEPDEPVIMKEFEEKQVCAFNRIIDKIKSRNIPLLLIQAPCSNMYNSHIKNGIETDAFFEKVVDKNTRYVNYNHPSLQRFQADSLFIDDDHLSQEGVNLFNRHLIMNFVKDKSAF